MFLSMKVRGVSDGGRLMRWKSYLSENPLDCVASPETRFFSKETIK